MSPRPSLRQRRRQLRHQRQVPGRQRRHADDVHVVLDRLARGLVGRREQRADVDVEAEVGERRGDHLLAAVVAVLAHLGDQDARPAAVGLLERRAHARARARTSLLMAPDLRGVDARDRRATRRGGGRTPSPAPSEISPTVALARAASTASSSRLPLPAAAVSVSAFERGRRPRLGSRSALQPLQLGDLAARARPCCRPSAPRSSASSVDAVLVDADDGLRAGVDARLRAGGGLLDAHLGDAGVRSPWPCRPAPRPRRCAPRPCGRDRR